VHEALRLDFGPQWKKRIKTKQPAGVGKAFPALVPQVAKTGTLRCWLTFSHLASFVPPCLRHFTFHMCRLEQGQ